MRIRKSLVAFVLTGALTAMFGSGILVSAENQGTDGTEIQVMEAEQLEIQLEMVKHFCNITTEQISSFRISLFKWCHISI